MSRRGSVVKTRTLAREIPGSITTIYEFSVSVHHKNVREKGFSTQKTLSSHKKRSDHTKKNLTRGYRQLFVLCVDYPCKNIV